ncbi:MAG TPA: isoamylase early set domain-containing protein [Gemmatimonadaceae bacterium]
MAESRDPFIDQIAAELRRPVRFDPRFDERVMDALNAPEVIPLHPARQATRPWIVRPWTLRVSPIGAFAVAAGLVGVAVFGAWQLSGVERVQVANQQIVDNLVPVANKGEEPLVVHQFTYYQKGLKSIALVGEFNDWQADSTALTEVSPGVWTVSLRLRPGVYEYQFILDGTQRVTDPTMPQASSDFGSPNSVVTVSAKVPQ